MILMQTRLPSLERLLGMAARTTYYRSQLELVPSRNVDEALESVAPVSPHLVRAHPELFQPPEHGPLPSRPVRLPYRTPPRTAILEAPHIEAGRKMRRFPSHEPNAVARFEPQVLVAPLETLLSYALCQESGRAPALPLTHSVVALTRLGGMALDEGIRQQLWAALKVPVFEQLEWFDGSLVAEECEAHTGLHLQRPGMYAEVSESGEVWLTALEARNFPVLRVASGFVLDSERTACGCGEMVPRLVRAAERKGDARVAAVAVA